MRAIFVFSVVVNKVRWRLVEPKLPLKLIVRKNSDKKREQTAVKKLPKSLNTGSDSAVQLPYTYLLTAEIQRFFLFQGGIFEERLQKSTIDTHNIRQKPSA